MNASTSWGRVAKWYDNLLEKDEGTYQKNLILPNLLRLLQTKRGETILDLACGQGFFSREFAKAGAKVIGVDVSKELIDFAKKYSSRSKNLKMRDNSVVLRNVAKKQLNNRIPPTIEYHVAPADNINFLNNKSIDKITLILALQNIENVHGVLTECNRVLRENGQLFIVLNHPAFRIPKKSSWEWDEKQKIQYRRIDSYLTESKIKIQMHPGSDPKNITWSFHRPLQFYLKILNKYDFCVSRLEEWNSNKISESGPMAEAENRARREFPLFLFIGASCIWRPTGKSVLPFQCHFRANVSPKSCQLTERRWIEDFIQIYP